MQLENLIFGGKSNQNQHATSDVNFNPNFGNGGGNLNMMGNIGGGSLNQGGSSTATGAGFDFKFSGIPVMLEDLATDIGHFHADKGSDTYFDYRKGDPLAASNIGKLSKSAGGNIHFKGASGRQENGVVDRFRDSSRGALNASGSDRNARGTAMADHASVLADKSRALRNMQRDNQRLVLLI
mmetsp:Transcript_13535/g.23047  ORF Transcript_13535/g.23047 Transcript_13535/m.23047 type:complete len:182 (-) Transcript_13535:55-600(-)